MFSNVHTICSYFTLGHCDCPENEDILGRYSLGQIPFGNYSKDSNTCVLRFNELFPKENWCIQKKEDISCTSYTLDVLNFGSKKDRYSCGHYILATLCYFF